MADPIIRLRNVSKFYKLYQTPRDRLKEALHPLKKKYHRDFFALNKVSMDIDRGEVIGIVGRNGSGKSTLLKIIAGIIQPSSGLATVKGRISALFELGGGLSPQLSGIQNIEFTSLLMGCSRSELPSRKEEVIDFADIGQFIHQPMSTYSSGMKARLSFALAVMIRPEILIVDEVLAVGDELFKKKCYDRMNELVESGCTILFVSHSTQTVDRLCSRSYLLDAGEVLIDGPAPMVSRYYAKLLYAPVAGQAAIKQEIRQLNGDETLKQKHRIHTELRKVNVAVEYDDNQQPTAYLIPGLKPQSTIRQGLGSAEIDDIVITAWDGQPVNALIMNDNYQLSYRITFHENSDKVRVATLIQGAKGIHIAGYTQEMAPLSVSAGQRYLVQMGFCCRLLPGTYFITITVTRPGQQSERVHLVGIHDASIFKVLEEKNKSHWGLVNLEQNCRITLLDETGSQTSQNGNDAQTAEEA